MLRRRALAPERRQRPDSGFVRASLPPCGPTLLRGPSPAPEGLRLEATLRAQASLITYRRRYQPVPDLAGALRLLITDLAHPRALAFQLACLQGHLESLPRPVAGPFGNERALIREAGNAVSLADTACPSGSCDTEALRRLLEPVLSEVERLLRLCSDGLTARYLADTYVPRRLLAGNAGV